MRMKCNSCCSQVGQSHKGEKWLGSLRRQHKHISHLMGREESPKATQSALSLCLILRTQSISRLSATEKQRNEWWVGRQHESNGPPHPFNHRASLLQYLHSLLSRVLNFCQSIPKEHRPLKSSALLRSFDRENSLIHPHYAASLSIEHRRAFCLSSFTFSLRGWSGRCFGVVVEQ